MKRQSSYSMKMVCLVSAAAIMVATAGRGRAEIIMSEPTNLGPVINDATDMQECDFSHDGLELYFSSLRPGGYGRKDIWVAKRETVNSAWQEPVNLGPVVNSAGAELEPSISGDGLQLYLGCWDDYILRVCTRPSKDAPWSAPVKIGPPLGAVDTAIEVGSDDAWTPEISADGLCLYFTSTRLGGYGGYDIWVATRATKNDPWDAPANLGPNVNTGADDWSPSISTDGLTLVFNGGWTIRATTRRSVGDDWSPAVDLGIRIEGNQGYQHGAALSPDGSCLYFENYYSQWGGYGQGDFWQVTFTPVVDFDADGIVGAMDMAIMADNWHTHHTLCDIAPLPVGDGYVDVKDLLVLADFLEPGDPTLIAHWTLDETEGTVASDSAADHHGTVVGTPVWRPDGGRIDGALELDGNTFVAADHVLNPSEGPFSVLAWVRGGAPGQAILSQVDGANWLGADPTNGCLITELKGAGRDKCALCSQANIIDGDWHHVGLVWEDETRTLYVDDIMVARGTQAGGPAGCSGGLNIGCDKVMATGAFFTGLVDDVRIYNRATKP